MNWSPKAFIWLGATVIVSIITLLVAKGTYTDLRYAWDAEGPVERYFRGSPAGSSPADALQEHPGDPMLLVLAAATSAREPDGADRAMKFYEELAAKLPKDPSPDVGIGVLKLKRALADPGKPDEVRKAECTEAAAACKQAQGKDEGYLDAVIFEATALLHADRVQEAIDLFVKAEKAFPDKNVTLPSLGGMRSYGYNRALAHHLAGDADAAFDMAARTVLLAPKDPRVGQLMIDITACYLDPWPALEGGDKDKRAYKGKVADRANRVDEMLDHNFKVSTTRYVNRWAFSTADKEENWRMQRVRAYIAQVRYAVGDSAQAGEEITKLGGARQLDLGVHRVLCVLMPRVVEDVTDASKRERFAKTGAKLIKDYLQQATDIPKEERLILLRNQAVLWSIGGANFDAEDVFDAVEKLGGGDDPEFLVQRAINLDMGKGRSQQAIDNYQKAQRSGHPKAAQIENRIMELRGGQ